MYETICQGGDVDTNCAIVGGIIGIASPPPEKWVKYCVEMEGVVNDDGHRGLVRDHPEMRKQRVIVHPGLEIARSATRARSAPA
jgi:hypothetical protein